MQFKPIEVEVAEQPPSQEMSLHTESLQHTKYSQGDRKNAHGHQLQSPEQPPQRIQVMRARSPPNSNEVIIENSYTTSSYESKFNKL